LFDVFKTYGHADSWKQNFVRAVAAGIGQRSVGGGEVNRIGLSHL
jgi:hypothetical protein